MKRAPKLGKSCPREVIWHKDKTTIRHIKDLANKGNVFIVVGRLLDSRTEDVKDRNLLYKTQSDTMDRDNPVAVKRLSSNNDYYSNVFKKTERTVSVVFYILSYIERTEQTEFHIKVMSEKAMQVHEASLMTLSLYEYEAKEKIFPFEQSLVALEGAFRIANAARVLNDEVLTLLLTELDLVQRYLRNHFAMQVPLTLRDSGLMEVSGGSKHTPRPSPRLEPRSPRPRVSIPKGDISSDAHMVYSQLVDRATRIKTVLEAIPGATIKDIAEVITDVSEKTIQRELNSLIEKGQVIRQGERRWSKYSMTK